MASVQFYGIENAIDAYENCKIAAWGLFSGRQLLCKYTGGNINEGKQLLEEFCEKIEHSNATYTLKVFENEKGTDMRIKEKTECDSSFNFKLLEEDKYLQRRDERGNYSSNGNNKLLVDTLTGINNRLIAIEEGDHEDEPDTIGSIVTGYLKEPEKLLPLLTLLSGLGVIRPVPAGAIGNVQKTTTTDMSDIITDKLAAALDQLQKADPKIVEHLEKLAELSKRDKFTFDIVVSKIEAL